ncbi:MAG: hypothetical protein RL757_2366 [Bacteroidota bacterium]|jgi:hypothetical protein
MRLSLPNQYFIFLIFLFVQVRAHAQESVKLTFFKTGVLEYRQSASFGAKMPEKSIIGLMVSLKKAECQGLDLSLNGKIVLLPAQDCGVLTAAQNAEKAGAIAVVVIDKNKENIAQTERILKIPCLVIDEGTGIFYQQQAEKPTLVCLSGSMYSGKIVSEEPTKVQDVALDDYTRSRVSKPILASESPRPEEIMASVRPIQRPEIEIDPNATPDVTPNTVSTIALEDARPEPVSSAPTPAMAAPEPVIVASTNTDFAAKGENSPPPSITPQNVPQTAVESKKTSENSLVESEELRGQIEIYPKRVSEFLSVTYSFDVRTDAVIKINNAEGKTVIEKNIVNALTDFAEFEVLKLPVGAYKVLVTTADKRATFDITVQH